jgi:hypothetical protein
MKVKYYGHNSLDGGSKSVSFVLPESGIKWRVTMPANYPSNSVLEWIKNEGIEDFLTEKYYKDKQYDEDNNIRRRECIRLHSFMFFFNSFDGDIEIYRARIEAAGYGSDEYSWGLVKDIDNLFDFYNEKTINQIKDKIEEEYSDIKVKSIKIVKEDTSRGDKDFGDLRGWIRDNKLNQIL